MGIPVNPATGSRHTLVRVPCQYHGVTGLFCGVFWCLHYFIILVMINPITAIQITMNSIPDIQFFFSLTGCLWSVILRNYIPDGPMRNRRNHGRSGCP